jgi:hypothetical protein
MNCKKTAEKNGCEECPERHIKVNLDSIELTVRKATDWNYVKRNVKATVCIDRPRTYIRQWMVEALIGFIVILAFGIWLGKYCIGSMSEKPPVLVYKPATAPGANLDSSLLSTQ